MVSIRTGIVDPTLPAARALVWAGRRDYQVPAHLAPHYRPADGIPDTESACRTLARLAGSDWTWHAHMLTLAQGPYEAQLRV